MNKTLAELENLLIELIDTGAYVRHKDLTVNADSHYTIELTYNSFGNKWMEIEYDGTNTKISSYNHLLGEQIIIAKVIPILKEIIEMNKVSIEDKRVARIATLEAEKEKIEQELKSLSCVDGKEVENA